MRVELDHVKAPDAALVGADGPVIALTRLADGRMVSILDVEQILARALGEPGVPDFEPLVDAAAPRVLFADDSPVGRRAIARVLDKLGVRYTQAANGEEAWQKLQAMAAQAQSEGALLRDRLRVILTDAEMPQMDGYLLARLVKSDRRFEGVAVVMHTALSPSAASAMSPATDVDAYVPKSNPVGLADALRPMLRDRFPSTALN
jgi:two-component system chemotaxis response regulator CheV